MAKHPSLICRRCENMLLSGKVPPATTTSFITKIWSCRFYESAVKKCIHHFKYQHKTQIINIFTEILRKTLSDNIISSYTIEFIIPVPIHKKRHTVRGFNQSKIIAKALSEILFIPLALHTLIKTKNTLPQTKLPKKLRNNNLRSCFSVPNPYILQGKTVMLVDDVTTTGSTLNACAIELIKAGVKEVFGFTLARTR